VQTTYANSTGVNMDQELSNLIVLQNSYSASARLITVADTMFQSVLAMT
jgi:flagellar hook-associated protein 1 FlgK